MFSLSFFSGHIWSIRKVRGQGPNLSPTVTYATAMNMPDPLTHCSRLGLNPCLHSDLSCYSQILNPLCQWELLHELLCSAQKPHEVLSHFGRMVTATHPRSGCWQVREATACGCNSLLGRGAAHPSESRC